MQKIFYLLLACMSLSVSIIAQDRYFAYTYTSNVLPKNAIDIEWWHTSRMGHKGQYFHAQDRRMELEFGLGRQLQTSIYFNSYQTRSSDSSDGTSSKNEMGFSNEWKWKLSDPSLNKVGFCLYGEWGLKGGDEVELETKIIFDKYIGNHLLAFNTVVEYEKEFEWVQNEVESEEWESPIEFDFGYQYLTKKHIGIGFEVRNHNQVSKDFGWEHSVFFAGPMLNFRASKWFIIVNYLPQLGNVKKTTIAPKAMVLDEQEKTEFRIIAGISL